MTTFPIVYFPFISSSISASHHQRMEFTFHNSYVILELVPSTVILCTERSCWRKGYSNKATLILGWSHRYKNYTVVITIWLTVTKYQFHKLQRFCYFLRRCFCPLSLQGLLPDLTVYMSNTAGTACSSRTPECTPDFLVGSVLLILLVFWIVLLWVFTFWLPCCDVHYNFCIKTIFGSYLPPVVCRRVHVLFTLFVGFFAYCGVQHILCCVFVLFLSSCIPYVAGFSGLSFFDSPLGIL